MVHRGDAYASSSTVSTRLDERDSLSRSIVRAVAALEDQRPTDLPPLGDAVDPDSLESLARAKADGLRIAFTYCGHEVVVTADRLRVH